jgi:nucleoid DNA-binding protein
MRLCLRYRDSRLWQLHGQAEEGQEGEESEDWELVEVPAKRVPHFKPGMELKAMVEGD